MTATVKLPAEAESYQVEIIAHGRKAQVVEKARGEAEKTKLIGMAEASCIENIGRANAEAMRLKAAVFKQYGDAAIAERVLDALPEISGQIAAPLAKTEEIVMLSGSSNLAGELNKLVGQVPPAIQAMTGVDISQILRAIPGAK